ncbi:PAS domain S-box protein [candidate division KSB1 bacterium]|nr:PAS domain S-box protein [candidate division KSB1 bacterium]
MLNGETAAITEVNHAAVRLYQYSRDEMLTMNAIELSAEPEKSRKMLHDDTGRIPLRYHRKKDGTIFPVEILYSDFDHQGHPMRIATVRDITQRKQAEQALLQSERFLQNIFDGIQDGISVLDSNLNIVRVNAWMKKMYAAQAPLTGNKCYRVYQKRDSICPWCPSLHTIKTGDVKTEIVPYPSPDKPTRLIELTSFPIKDMQGNVANIIEHVKDITERIRAEEALRTSEAQLSNAMKIAKLGYWEYDVAEDLFTFNDHFYSIFRTSVEQVGGYKMSPSRYAETFLHPDDMAQVAIEMKQALETTDPHFSRQLEHRIIYADGEIGYLPVRYFVVKDDQGRTIKTYGANQDITEHKRIQEVLREREERFRELFENMSSGVAIYEAIDNGRDFVFKDFNKGSERMENIKKEEVVGRSVIEVFPGVKEFGLFDIFQRVWQTGKSEHQPISLYKDDRICGWRKNYVCKLPSGEIVAIYDALTAQKQAEEALRKSEEKLRLLFNHINDVFYSVDRNGTILEISPSVTRILGYKSEQLIGKSFPDLNILSPESQQRALSDTMKVFSGESIDIAQYEFYASDGTSIYGEVSGSPIYADGKIIAVASVARNITDRKRAEAEKAKLEEQLRRSQKLETIGTLAGGIAHDFNNILTPIMGYADMALSSLSPSNPLHEDLEHILRAATRAKDLVEQILIFSRQLEKERKPLSLHLIVKKALKLLRPAIPTTIDIQQRIDSSCDKVLADASKMHQVIVNLCTNAYQAMEDKAGTVTIELKQVHIDADMAKIHPNLNEADYVRLTISDTGIGMNEATMERIFEPFFTTKTVDKGTGMGLSVVHGIVRSHNGEIIVLSVPGKGSKFHVYLPTAKTEMITNAEEEQPIPGGHESILVVDDEEAVAEVLKRLLQRIGYRVVVRTNSIEALKDIRHQSKGYDLVIVDLTMPGMKGLDFARRLHKIRADLPIILMTGYGENITNGIQKQYGIKQIISKSITLKELALTIRCVIDA